MALCIICILPVPEGVEICPHHVPNTTDKEWSDANRAAGNFFHRGIVPVVPASEPLPTEPIVAQSHTTEGADSSSSQPPESQPNRESVDGASNDNGSVDPSIA